MRLNHCQTFCVTNSLLCMSILNSPFCCLQVLYQIYFKIFPFSFRMQHCSLICASPFHLILNFFQLLFLCVLNSAYGFTHCHWLNCNVQCTFLALILILILRFKLNPNLNQIFFFIENIRYQNFNITNRDQQSLIGSKTTFLIWFSFYLKLVDNHCVIFAIL